MSFPRATTFFPPQAFQFQRRDAAVKLREPGKRFHFAGARPGPDYSRRVCEVGFTPAVRYASRIIPRAERPLRVTRLADVTHQFETACFTHPTTVMNNPG